jgi:hypothetical protein
MFDIYWKKLINFIVPRFVLSYFLFYEIHEYMKC